MIHIKRSTEECEKEFIMHTDTGDAELRSITTTAAFIAGIKAISFDNNKTNMLPFFRMKYYTSISNKKMQILKVLQEDMTCCKSFEELGERTKMSLPLISYHINGNLKSEGLKKMGLVQTQEDKGRITVHLSRQGMMLMDGLIQEDNESANAV